MKSNSNYSICLLILGDLGNAGKCSLNSLVNIDASNICVITDAPGKVWLLDKIDSTLRSKLCFHSNKEIDAKINYLNIFNESNYVGFGNERFFRLMILKWQLILDIFQKHNNEFAIYSDLDVFWRKAPINTINKLMSSHYVAAIQDDFNEKLNKEYLCPGIMIWKNSQDAKKIVREIYEFQKIKIESNENFPDDKALNAWLSETKRYGEIMRLSATEFVIGHKFLRLMLNMSNLKVNQLVAFHANYAIGLEKKYIMLKAVSGNLSLLRRLFSILYAIYWKIESRVKK